MKIARVLLATVGSTLLSIPATAHADTFDFSFGTAGQSRFNGSGVLTGDMVSTGEYLITGITGTTNTGNGRNRPIVGLEATGEFQGNDNLLFENNGVFSLDDNGLAYVLRNGAQINLFSVGEILERSGGNFVRQGEAITITGTGAATTPEPGSILLMGTGLLGALAAARRRFPA